MALEWRRVLVWLTLFSFSVRIYAASSAEDRAFTLALNNFNRGFWSLADNGFAAFLVKYPKSERGSEAILYQAEARFKMERYADAIELLSANQFTAGGWADQYLYWLARAQFQIANYSASADAFARLSQRYPGSNAPLYLEASVNEATARARLGQWPRIVQLLQPPAGAFQTLAKSVTNEVVARGYLLLGEAKLQLKEYASANAALERSAAPGLKPEIDWRRFYLQTRVQVAEGKLEDASHNTTNLVALAQAADDPRLQAETTVLRADILERLNLPEEAIATYHSNLATNAPAEQQAHALVKIAELSLERGRIADAVRTLEKYLEHPPAAAADLALLWLGELQLRQFLIESETNHSEASANTNLLNQALARFDAVLHTNADSRLAGKALLGKGWCLWTVGQYPQSEQAFRLAAERLPFSKDQAVARFKWADAQFQQKDFAGAVTNYEFLAEHYVLLPEVKDQLLEPALYQAVQAAIACTNGSAADDAVRKILEWYPDGFAGPRCLLLLGEALSRQRDPAGARKLFAEFGERFPANSLWPEVRLAIARTYEDEGNWPAAMVHYETWAGTYTNHAELPRAEFRLARATSMAGQSTNSFMLLTNFVVRFPTSELAPQAQWCIGDYYWGNGEFYSAERSYQWVFINTNWAPSELTYQAPLMAGRAAMARLSYKDAIGHFTNLYYNPNCPPDLRIQAAFATGDAFMMSGRRADLEEALGWFNAISAAYPTNRVAPLVYARIGDCYQQLAVTDPGRPDLQKFADAANAYQQAITNSNASAATRYQAKIGLATVAEKQASQKTGEEQARLLNLALNYCLEVIDENAYPEDEAKRDPLSAKEAGLRAGRLAETLKEWKQAISVYSNMRELLPAYRTTWDSKILAAQKHLE